MKLHEYLTKYDWYYKLTTWFTFIEFIFVIGIILWALGV